MKKNTNNLLEKIIHFIYNQLPNNKMIVLLKVNKKVKYCYH